MVSSLSAGLVVRGLLCSDAGVRGIARKVFPVVVGEARLPYVAYRRVGLEQDAVKGSAGSDAVRVEVLCFAESYEGSLELAEAVRRVLDGARGVRDGLVMRSCVLVDAEEGYEGDAFVQSLTFRIRLGS
ncbi:MAG: DUF3168 domain-containing protein [Alloprevotella sp.]